MKIKNLINNPKKLNQISKFLTTALICIGLILGLELLFSIPEISSFFDEGMLEGRQGIIFWVILWLIMFAQVTFIPIPAMPIYVLCNSIPNLVGNEGVVGLFSGKTLFFCAFVTSACLAGCILAYAIGRCSGKKITKWIAGDEEEFNNWCKLLNGKKGKLIYTITVFFPLFPDDLLSIAMGSLKMNFKFYVLINAIGKFIGAFCMLLFMRLPFTESFFDISKNNGFPSISAIIYMALMFIFIILLIACKIKKKKLKEKQD